MIIEIESYLGNRMLFGKSISEYELRKLINQILLQTDENQFLYWLCSRYNFEKIKFSNEIEADYVVDLDTHEIYKPKF